MIVDASREPTPCSRRYRRLRRPGPVGTWGANVAFPLKRPACTPRPLLLRGILEQVHDSPVAIQSSALDFTVENSPEFGLVDIVVPNVGK